MNTTSLSSAAYRTTPLLTNAEAMEAMKKAAGAGYQQPKQTRKGGVWLPQC